MTSSVPGPTELCWHYNNNLQPMLSLTATNQNKFRTLWTASPASIVSNLSQLLWNILVCFVHYWIVYTVQLLYEYTSKRCDNITNRFQLTGHFYYNVRLWKPLFLKIRNLRTIAHPTIRQTLKSLWTQPQKSPSGSYWLNINPISGWVWPSSVLASFIINHACFNSKM